MASKYAAKGAIRSMKNVAKGFSDIQIKVRKATSNDPWGPSSQVMAEIAESSFDPQLFLEIMDMIDKRLNDHGRNWRHVFKSLTLLDYIIHLGSENVVKYARDNLYIVKTLKEFQFIDEEGKDQGQHVRQKAKDITALLSDDNRLREERQRRQNMQERFTGRSSEEYRSYGAVDHNNSSPSSTARKAAQQEDEELQLALEESRKTAQRDQQKRHVPVQQQPKDHRLSEDEQLQRALKLSKQEDEERQRRTGKTNDMINLFGGNEIAINPFGPGQTSQQYGGSSSYGMPQTQQPYNNNAYPGFTPNMPTGAIQQQHTGYIQAQPTGFLPPQHTGMVGETNPFGTTFNIGMNHTGMTNSSYGYSSSNDGVIHNQSTGYGDPNAQLAHVVKNSNIDPFGSIAMQRTGTTGSLNGSPFMQPAQLFGQQQTGSTTSGMSISQSSSVNPFSTGNTTSNDPFGSVSGRSATVQSNNTGISDYSTSNLTGLSSGTTGTEFKPLVDMDNILGAPTGTNMSGYNKNPFGGTSASSKHYEWNNHDGAQIGKKTLNELAGMNGSLMTSNVGMAQFGTGQQPNNMTRGATNMGMSGGLPTNYTGTQPGMHPNQTGNTFPNNQATTDPFGAPNRW